VKQQYPGFGFDPDKYTHFFSVHLPSAKDTGAVKVVEHFDWKGETPDVAAVDPHSPDLKVMIKKEYFREVADAVKAEFNRRLTARGLPTGRWPARGGTALLSPRFGKELVILLWAIEEVQRGWRKAVRYALTENPVVGNADAILPEYFQRASGGPNWSLFGEASENEGKMEPKDEEPKKS